MKRILLISVILIPILSFSQVNIGATKYVNKLSDFPAPVANEILLDSLTTYIVNTGIVLGSNYITMQNKTKIEGSNASTCYLMYSGNGACIRSSGVTVTIRSITIIAYGGINTCAWDLRDTSRTQMANVLETLVMFSDSVGGYYGFEVVNHLTNLWKDNRGGCVFDSVYYASYSNNILRTASTGSGQRVVSFINADNAQGYVITNSLWVTQHTGDTCIYMQHSTIQHIDFGSLYGCSFIGDALVQTAGFNPSDHPQWNYVANVGVENYYIIGNLTTAIMSTYVSPPTGLLMYNTDLDALVVFDGTDWGEVTTSVIYTNIFTEDWSSGNFTANSWTTVNNSVNYWCVGTDDPYTGTYSAYVTNDACVNNAYTINNSEVSHFYKDIAIPTGINDLQLRFYWKCEGEVGYDYLRIYNAPTSVTPVAGTLVSGTYQIGNDYNNSSTFTETGISLGNGDAGTTRRFIFSWRNDGSVGTQPPANLGTIEFNYK